MDRINVLLLEDNSGDAYLVKDQLKDIKNFDFKITEARYLAEAIEILKTQSFAAILIDLMLPDSQGLETFKEVDRQAPNTPIIVTSAMSEENLAIAAVREGAQDYLVKGEIVPKSLAKTIQYAIERKTITEQLKQRTQELEYYNQELQTFSYSVSHDLKNPLNFIKGMSSLLLNKRRSQPLEHQDRICIERIYKSSLRMEQITRNLLNLSKVQQSQMLVEKINLSELTTKIFDNLQQQQPEREVKFITPPGITAKGDLQLITLALENMLGNAWKYTKNNPNAQIEFGVDANSDHVYYLEDNGIGFNEAEADHLFTPFERLSNSENFEGTGIGLATVKRIIDRHQGEIWFKAQPGKGACFIFSLPV